MAGKKKSPQDVLPELWKRQDGEGAQAFQAFAEYRDMGAERSLAKVAQKLGKSKALMERWSSRWHWGVRVDAWDDEMDRQVREELAKGITEMRRNHVGIAKAMLVKSLQALKKIPAEEMTSRDIATMVDVAAKLERISRGEATERTEGKRTITGTVQASLGVQNIDFSGLTDGELEQLDGFLNKLATE